MLNIIPEKLTLIFNTKSIEEVCSVLNSSMEQLRSLQLLAQLPLEYQNITIETPEEVQEWFDKMKGEKEVLAGGFLSDTYGLFEAALGQLRNFGFHRDYNA